MIIKEVIDHLEHKFPLEWQEDFDNSGLQCGNINQDITGALVCFEFSDKVIDEAIKLHANFVVAHHPLIFGQGLKKVEPSNRVGRLVCKAIENHLVLYAMHTNMDSGIGGGNVAFAQKLHLQNAKVLEPKYTEGPWAGKVGLGQVGSLPEAMPLKDFLLILKKELGLQHVKYMGDDARMIQTVAVCGGAGQSLIRQAMAAKADVFITGDIRYHDYFTPDNQMALVDIGHYEGEHFIKDIIYAELKENFSTFAVNFSKLDNLEVLYA